MTLAEQNDAERQAILRKFYFVSQGSGAHPDSSLSVVMNVSDGIQATDRQLIMDEVARLRDFASEAHDDETFRVGPWSVHMTLADQGDGKRMSVRVSRA